LMPERPKRDAVEILMGERHRIGEPAVNRSVARSFRLWSPGRHGTRVEADILRLSCAVPRPSPSIDASGSDRETQLLLMLHAVPASLDMALRQRGNPRSM
jgi:hypothetical protein